MKQLIKSFNNKNIDRNIFTSAENVNINTIVGYHKDKKRYSFLDEYDRKIYLVNDIKDVKEGLKDILVMTVEPKLNEIIELKDNIESIRVKVIGIFLYDDEISSKIINSELIENINSIICAKIKVE